MNKLLVVVFSVLLSLSALAQNVGQEKGDLLNYSDINGNKQGQWKKKYNNGELKYEAYFIDNKPVGSLKRYDTYGNMVAHLVYDSVGEKATATFYHSSGKEAAVGFYIDKNKDSVWRYFNAAGTFYLQESFKEGVNHGQFLNATSEGVVIEELNWENGVKHGAWKKRFVEGSIMWEAEYVQGKLEGTTKTYYKSGILHKEGKFIDDLMEGPWKIYSESGNLQKVYQYKRGSSPEALKDQEELLEELERNKDKFQGPENGNDFDWLRGNSSGY